MGTYFPCPLETGIGGGVGTEPKWGVFLMSGASGTEPKWGVFLISGAWGKE